MSTRSSVPDVVRLDDPRALDPGLSGAKAANLARAAVGGLPVLPGFALTTRSFAADSIGRPDLALELDVEQELREAWETLTRAHGEPLVVRSSSTIEDIGESSMAGQFTSLLDVSGWDDFTAAVRKVLASAGTATPGRPPLPMAVLVQRQLDADCGGVLFGIDPVSGDPHRAMAEVVPGGPDKLVSGTVTAAAYHLGRRGRLLDSDDTEDPPRLDRRRRRELWRMARQAQEVFDRPQDVEWAYDRDGRLWLLQSRPVTATGELYTATGPVLGPGPVGETFPEPLLPLEEELWIPPLREGIVAALRVTSAASRRRVEGSPVVLTVGGRVACDLELLGVEPEKRSAWRWLDPRQPARRVLSAWRVGRLRAVLPRLAREVLRRVDGQLGSVPPFEDLTDEQLVGTLQRARRLLVSVHGHEVLAGTLLEDADRAVTGAGLGLSAVAAGRRAGLSDLEIVARSPVSLALVAPHLEGGVTLPDVPDAAGQRGEVGDLAPREGLRLRARWVQELTVRLVHELERRLHATGRLPEDVPLGRLPLAALEALVTGPESAVVPDGAPPAAGPPLPAAFRRTESGGIAPVRRRAYRGGGRGAGGGRGEGRVVHASAHRRPPDGSVLVVRNLDPGLAGALPRLAGIVAETGSTLSHLAILAREYDVPTVVAVHDALHRFPEGIVLVVDGDTGEVRALGEESGTGTASPNDRPTPSRPRSEEDR